MTTSSLKTMRRTALSALLLAFLTSGCDSFLDVNDPPNDPEQASPQLRLPALLAGFGHRMYYGEAGLWGAEWTQQFSYNRATRSYAEVHRYELQDTDGSSAWNFYFAQVMQEANNIVKETDPMTDGAYHGIAKFILAWSWAHVTDLWGPVPYREAFDITIREPKYDDQKTVYDAVHVLFEEAIAAMQRPASRVPIGNDLLFAGNMTRWVKLARTVQARHQLRLAYAPGENAQQRAQKALDALAGGFTSNADDADFAYPGGEAGLRNPLWTFQDRAEFRASEFWVELLRSRSDSLLSTRT